MRKEVKMGIQMRRGGGQRREEVRRERVRIGESEIEREKRI